MSITATEKTAPLSEMRIKECRILVGVMREGLAVRLASMGLAPGACVTMVRNGGATVVVAVDRTYLALDQRIVADILVGPVVR